jgi:ABC-2 type transport system permease protein
MQVAWTMTMRDMRLLLRKQLVAFLLRVLVVPLLLLFTFSYVLPVTGGSLNGSGTSLGTVIIPGIIAATVVFAGIMGVTVPMIAQLTFPREIDDRLVMPIPVWGIALQKIVSGTIQALIAALIVVPLLIFVHAPHQPPHLHVTSWPELMVVFFFAGTLSAGLGLLIGTLLDPMRINMLFSVIMTPAMMLGCMYFSWPSLARIRWLQVAVLFNPIVYMSEAFRANLTPTVSHMDSWAFLLALIGGTLLTALLGTVTFRRRVRR